MANKDKFDTTRLSEEDKTILEKLYKRRITIQNYINDNSLNVTVCPGCGLPSLPEDWFHDICSICNWQHTGQDDPNADEVWGGPNYELSLTENRLKIGRILDKKSKELVDVLKENPSEILETWRMHQERMDLFDEEKIMHALRGDEIWMKWDKARKKILDDLIKK